MTIRYVVSIITLAVFTPYPSWEHFIWPLDNCVLADFCNHTWIPECGIENGTKGKVHLRLFIDECDMFEYNCDRKREYVVTNYSLCYGPGCVADDEEIKSPLRIGDYRVVGPERKLVYDPTDAVGRRILTTNTPRITFPSTTVPDLPKYMLSGRRRFTPHGPPGGKTLRKPHRPVQRTTKAVTKRQKPTTTLTKPKKKVTLKKKPQAQPKISTEPGGAVILKRVTFMKNGKTFVRVFRAVKRIDKATPLDSDFIE